MSNSRAVWIFLLALTAIRLGLIALPQLAPDEAYYWMWSQRPALSYFSKGPGVAFVIRSSTAIFGDNEFGVRFWSPWLGFGTSLLLYYFSRRLFSPLAAFWTVLAVNITPIFSLGSLVMTIDPLSIFFWVAAFCSFWLALEGSPRFSWWWPLTGLLIGLGFLCKYTNALELVSIVLVLGMTRRLRKEFARPNLYLLLLVFALCTIPPIVWNQQHAWITLAHLKERGGLDHSFGFRPSELMEFFFEHFATYSPLFFVGLIWATIVAWPRAQRSFKVLFLLWFGLPVFFFYTFLSINDAAAPNWDGLSFLSLGVLAVSYWRERMASHSGRFNWPVAALLVALGSTAIMLGLMVNPVGIERHGHDPTDRLRGWVAFGQAVEKVRHDFEKATGEPVFLIADDRDFASELAFYLPEKRADGPGYPPVYLPESQDMVNQFSFWPRYDEFVAPSPNDKGVADQSFTEESGVNPFLGRTALFLQESAKTEEPPHNITAAFGSTRRVGTIVIHAGERTLRKVQVFACYDYRTLPL